MSGGVSVAADTSTCPECGARFRCGMEGGDPTCWCASLPPLAALPGKAADAPPEALRCLCPRCLTALLASAGAQRPAVAG